MSKVFFPIRYIDIPASPPHEGNPTYRVSFGTEHWGDGEPRPVYKVQMAYDGVVAGRKSPSYPAGSDDLDRVYTAMQQLREGKGKRSRGQITSAGDEPGIPPSEAHQILNVRAELE